MIGQTAAFGCAKEVPHKGAIGTARSEILGSFRSGGGGMKAIRLVAAIGAFAAIPAFAADTITIGMTVSRTGPLNTD